MPNPRQRKKHSAPPRPVASKRTKKKILANRMGRVNVTNETVRKHWDHDKNVAQNFRDLGLCADPNAKAGPGRAAVVKKRHQLAKKLAEHLDNPEAALLDEEEEEPKEEQPKPLIAELEELAATRKPYEAHSARGEALFVQQLLEKHGEDYDAMARDLKLNIFQHSAGQLKQRVKKYQKTLERHEAALAASS